MAAGAVARDQSTPARKTAEIGAATQAPMFWMSRNTPRSWWVNHIARSVATTRITNPLQRPTRTRWASSFGPGNSGL